MRSMAGCSIVFLTIIMMPALVVVSVLMLIAMAAAEFVTSIAFPFLIASIVFGTLAFVDAVRVVWRRWREGTLRELQPRELARPAVLCVVAFVLFVIMCVLTGSLFIEWWNSVGQEMQ